MRLVPGLPVILLIALGLRILWALAIPVDPVSDSAAYQSFASNIVLHGVYGFLPDVPGAYWAVGPSAIYAAGYLVFGVGNPLAVIVPNLISALAMVALAHDLGRRWLGETEGRLAALLLAVWPMGIQFTTVLASEVHFNALVLAGIAAWDRRSASMAGWLWLILSGVAFGAACYVRPIALLVPVALALADVLRHPRAILRAMLSAGVVTAIILAVLTPWAERNERVLGERVLVSTNFWPNFWMGNHPGTDGEYAPLPPGTPEDELERSDHMKALALEALRADPTGFVWRTLWKAAKLHSRETIGVVWNERGVTALVGDTGATALKALSTAFWYAILLAALAGIVVLARQTSAWAALLSGPVWLWAYFTGVHAVIVVGDRYHMPAVPFVALLAALAVVAATTRRPARSALSGRSLQG